MTDQGDSVTRGAWRPEVGDWVATTVSWSEAHDPPIGSVFKVRTCLRHTVQLVGRSFWALDELRPATLEEIATAQLVSQEPTL